MNGIFNETSLARVWRATQGKNLGLITAFRNDRPEDRNQYPTAGLFGEIHKLFGYIEVKRRYVDNSHPTETLYIVVSSHNDNGLLKGFLRTAGAKYGQRVFVLGSQLHHVGDKRDIEEIGDYHPERMDEYFNLLIPPAGFAMVERIVFLKGWTFFTFMVAHRRTGGHPVKEEY
jgi:hypothetical protein